MQMLVSLIAGLVFGLGLILAGMTDPAKVQAFLDLLGNWDPSLALVMGGAIAVAAPAFWWVERRRPDIDLPPRQGVTPRLLLGGALFGAGWGLAGYCPGPGLAGLAGGSIEALWFVPAMAAGLLLHRWASRG